MWGKKKKNSFNLLIRLFSVLILPPEDVNAEAGHGSVGNVSQPFVTETYRCLALYETKDTKNKPFKVAAEEKVDVLIKDKEGERHSGPRGAAERQSGDSANVWLQAGGWWRTKKRGWLGSLHPTWRSSRSTGTKMTPMALLREVPTKL